MTIFSRRSLLACIAALGGAAPAAWSAEPAFPQRAVRIVVAFAPGGATDLIARIVAQKLSELWGEPVIVDNRAGASGMVGTEFVARSAPDGHTLVLGTQTTHATNPALHAKVPYDALNDFAPITLVGSTPLALLVHPAVPAQNVGELIALMKREPGRLSYAGGNGTSQHLSAELFKRLAGVDMVHIPYKGAAPGMADLLAGQVQLMFDNLPTALPHVKSARLRGLAVTSETRSPLAPELPTLIESGLAGFSIATWFALFAPAATDAKLVERLNADVVRVLRLPEVHERLVGMGVDVAAGSARQLAEFHRAEMTKWAKLVHDAGAKAN